MTFDGDKAVSDGASVEVTDSDFRVVEVTRDQLVELQVDAEARSFSTRWTSVDALLRAVGPAPIYLRPLLRERRHGAVRSYRCLALFSLPSSSGGGVTTFDVAPDRFAGLSALALDAPSRVALSRIFGRALDGISFMSKD